LHAIVHKIYASGQQKQLLECTFIHTFTMTSAKCIIATDTQQRFSHPAYFTKRRGLLQAKPDLPKALIIKNFWWFLDNNLYNLVNAFWCHISN